MLELREVLAKSRSHFEDHKISDHLPGQNIHKEDEEEA